MVAWCINSPANLNSEIFDGDCGIYNSAVAILKVRELSEGDRPGTSLSPAGTMIPIHIFAFSAEFMLLLLYAPYLSRKYS